MVKIIACEQRMNAAQEPFFALILQGDLVFVQSQESGRYYATAKRCSITSTLSKEDANALVGREIPGRIEKVPCEEYEYVVPETAESIVLTHRWEFVPEGAAVPLRAVMGGLAA